MKEALPSFPALNINISPSDREIFSPIVYGVQVKPIIGKTNRDEIQNQMRLKFARKLQKRNVTEKSHTSYSQKWLSNVN